MAMTSTLYTSIKKAFLASNDDNNTIFRDYKDRATSCYVCHYRSSRNNRKGSKYEKIEILLNYITVQLCEKEPFFSYSTER
jgi:hypothetical protein